MHELDKSLTKTNYSYDVRTRINRISSSNLTLDNPTVLVSHFYSYDGNAPTYQGQYIPSCGFSYNGNINAVMSSYNFSGVYGSAPSEFNYAAVYGYKYDRLNRLTDADGMVGDFVVHAMGLGLGQGPVNDALAIGDERYSYDKIGNIKQLSRTVRHSDPMNTAVVSKVEGWNYYYNGFNKLTQVNGFPGTTTRTYTYDKNGNLLTDSYREIAATEYGRTAYPYYLEADNNKIAYLYSVDDQRMYKKVDSPTETTTEFYLQDATGKTVALRRKVGSAAATWEYYVNGSEREARIKNVTHDGDLEPNEIEFYLYDHLGNTRVVYEHTYAGSALELVINYAADYFPYGKVLREYVNTSTGDPEKFLTTQHERDKETGLDYRGARFYDSDVARFLSLDPLAKEFPAWSAYNYVMGNPIRLIDPTGRSPEGIDDPKKKDEQKEGRKDLDPNVGTDLPEYTVEEDAPDYGGMFKERNDKMLNDAISSLTGENKNLTLNPSNEGNSSNESSSGINPWGPGLIAAGQPWFPKRFVTTGSSPGTSLASKVLDKALPIKSPVRLPTPVINSSGVRVAYTKSAGRFAARWVPFVGWGLLIYDVYDNREEIQESAKSVEKTREKAVNLYGPGIFCFEKGTLIYAHTGLVPIENIILGDSVYSYNISKNKVELDRVVNLFTIETESIYELKFGPEIVRVTGEHPFFIINKGWTPVRELKVGDLLKSKNNDVELSAISILSRTVMVYNIEVDKNHNYFITKENILVHNKNITGFNDKSMILDEQNCNEEK